MKSKYERVWFTLSTPSLNMLFKFTNHIIVCRRFHSSSPEYVLFASLYHTNLSRSTLFHAPYHRSVSIHTTLYHQNSPTPKRYYLCRPCRNLCRTDVRYQRNLKITLTFSRRGAGPNRYLLQSWYRLCGWVLPVLAVITAWGGTGRTSDS